MSSKNSKPYNDSNKTRKSTRSRNNNSSKRKKKPQNTNLESTMRIRIDDERLNDFESLDTSFLEGRLDKKVKNNKRAKEKLLKEKKRKKVNFQVIKRILLLLVTVFIIVLAVILFLNISKKEDKAKVEAEAKNKKVEEKVQVKIDNNYIFVGDSYTNNLNFDDLDYHYIKNSEDNLTTSKALDDLNNKVYKYNPSIVFIELGFVDLKDNREHEEIVSDLEKIVEGIQKHRPYAKIYIESLYPINKDVDDYDEDSLREDLDNKEIKEFNKLILKMTKKKKVNYLDMFSLLEKEDKLDDKYTDNGIKLNDEGNDKVFEKIEKIVDDENDK